MDAEVFDMAMWMMAVEDKFTPWMQRCSGVYDIDLIWKDFMETFAEVADHIVGKRPKSKQSWGSWWTKDLTYLKSLKKSVRKAGQKFASTEIKSVHNHLQRRRLWLHSDDEGSKWSVKCSTFQRSLSSW